MSQLVVGILFGGALISSLGAISSYSVEKKQPTMKSVMRDFIIGSVLFLLIMQLLPDSSASLLSYISSFSFLSAMPSMSSSGGEDLDIQVGLPQF
jgi:RsiW-degrading membrane proteinase PrsW (M82 family)